MQQNTNPTYESVIIDSLRSKWMDHLRTSPDADPMSLEGKKLIASWARDSERDIWNAVYSETVSDLASIGTDGIVKRPRNEDGSFGPFEYNGKSIQLDSGNTSEFWADPDSRAHEYATIRANGFQRGIPIPKFGEWSEMAPSKLGAMGLGMFINANRAWESSAGAIGKWVGRTAAEMAFPPKEVARVLGIDEMQLLGALDRRSNQPMMRGAGDPAKDADVLERYDEFMLGAVEAHADDTQASWMRAARGATTPFLSTIPGGTQLRDMFLGTDPTRTDYDIRDVVGRAGGGALVKTAEMAGTAVGVMPYSIPAMASRNPRIAAALTLPFYAMGHSGAWDRRLEIYRDQIAHAEQNGLPRPAAPTQVELNEQARFAGIVEFGSEFVFDRVQRGMVSLLGWSAETANASRIGAKAANDAANSLAQSMTRRIGKLGVAKSAALVAGGAVVEGLEEAVPEAAKEIIDPLWIPEGYENDFWSADTAEAVGTGALAGLFMSGGAAAVGGAMSIGKRSAEKSAAEKAVGVASGIIRDKARRLATNRLTANSQMTRGSSMAMHHVEQIGAGDRLAMLVDGDTADSTITDDVRRQMDAVGIPSKPIGMFNGMRVYAAASQVDAVRAAIASGDAATLTGNPSLVEDGKPTIGAFVIRKSGRVVDVVPYSSQAEADSARPDLEATASKFGASVSTVTHDQLGSLADRLDAQASADATMSGLAPKRKQISGTSTARGIKSLHSELLTEAYGSKLDKQGRQNPKASPFSSKLLTEEEVGGATNADVDVEVRMFPVPETQLSDGERAITTLGGTKPVILDGSVRFTIRENGSTRVVEKPIDRAGAYLNQSNPDGLFLIRENGTAFTARNAIALLLHELRHQLVGRSRAGAEYMTRLMYLDPVMAMRGGVQYMRELGPEYAIDESGNLLTDEQMVVRFAAMHAAAESVLSDPEATQQEREQAMEDRDTAERFAEEMAATQIEDTTGSTLTGAAMWELVDRHARGASARRFANWLAYRLVKANWVGPVAKQSIYELRQRNDAASDALLQIHRDMSDGIKGKYEQDMRTHERLMRPAPEAGGKSTPAIGAVGAAAGGVGALISGGGDDDRIAEAGKALSGYASMSDEGKAEALSQAVSALASVVPALASATASISGVGTGGSKAISPSQRRAAPAGTPTAEQVSAAVGEAQQAQLAPAQELTPSERSALEVERSREQPMFAMRPERNVAFFSALSRAVSEVPEESMTPKAWSQRIKSMVNKGQVKQAEVDWSGFEDYLALPRDQKKLTKEEVQRAANNFSLDIVDASPANLTTEDFRADVANVTRAWTDELHEAMAEKQGVPLEDFDLPMEINRDIAAVYNGEFVPGDPNNNAYWQIDSEAENRLDDLAWDLNLPTISSELGEAIDFDGEIDSNTNYEQYTLPGGTNYRQQVIAVPGDYLSGNPDVSTYDSPHWENIANPIAHIRTKDRVSEDGAKVLFVEELQSDWAQEGRKKGFKSKGPPQLPEGTLYFQPGELEVNAAVQIPRPLPGTGGRTIWYGRTIEEATSVAHRDLQRAKIAAGPFVQSTDGWLNLALKSVIIDAINGGYDRVAFVNGEQSADRYDLAKAIDTLVYRKNQDGTFDFDAIKDSSVPFSRNRVNASELGDLVGVEIARKMEDGQGETASDYPAEYRQLSGVDLKVGGEGMTKFYDQVVPAAINKMIGKIGGNKATVIDAGTGARQIGFDVTDAMRKSVTDAGGMAMFSMRRDSARDWARTSKAVDDGRLTTVYTGSPEGFMEFDSQRMGATDRPVSIGAATSSTTQDGMWFTDSRSVASDAAGISRINMMPQVSRILNGATARLVDRLPAPALAKFERNAGIPLVDYRVSPENLADFMDNDGVGYESVIRGHVQFLSEMMENDPAAVSMIDQAFNSLDITSAAGVLAGSRGGVMRAANLNLQDPLLVDFEPGPLEPTPSGIDRVDEPFATQADRALERMETENKDGMIMFMPDGERRYFIRNPSQMRVVGSARDSREAAMYSKRRKSMDPDGGVGRSLASGIIDLLNPSEAELRATVLDRMKGGTKDQTFIPEQVGGIKQTVQFLAQRRMQSGLRKLDIMNPKDHEALARLIAMEAVAHMQASSEANALEWYDKTVRTTLDRAALVHPELATDPYAQMVFAIAFAITSQGQNVEDNSLYGLQLYESYKSSINPKTGIGKFNVDFAKGKSREAQRNNLRLANKMLKKLGPEEMLLFIRRAYTIKELRADGYKPGGELVSESVLGASVFGPKIGFGFLSNLLGNFEPVTMDMWFMRTMLRLAGSLSKFNPKTYATQRARFLEGVAQRKKRTDPKGIYAADMDPQLVAKATMPNARESSIEALARAVLKAHEKDFKLNRKEYDAKTRVKTQMVRAATTIVESLDKPRDTPKSGGERHNLRKIVKLAVAMVNEATGMDISNAAFQALIWYPEQELYRSLGVKLRVTSQDYAGAMAEQLRKRGFTDAQIAEATDGTNGPDGPGNGGRRRGGRIRSGSTAATRQVARKPDGRADGSVRPANQGKSQKKGVESQFSMRRGMRGARDEAMLRYVDKFDELLRYTRIAEQNRGTPLRGLSNPYTAARLLTDRLGARQREAERRYANILRRMYVAGVTVEEMDQFLTAQHARERNEYVASINAAFPDGGSGMMSDDADAILDNHRATGRFALLEGFANEWRGMLNQALVERRDAGLVSQDLFDRLNSRYRNYVPLRGAPAQVGDEDFDAWGEPGGSGLSTTGRGVPRALGRGSAAEGVTSQVAFVHEDSFRRVMRNEVGQAFLDVVLAVNDRLMAEVIRPRRRVLAGGEVVTMHDAGWMRDPRNFGLYVNAPVTINGHDYEAGDLVVIRVNNRRLADAMVTPAVQLRSFEQALRHVNNAWRFMTTGMGNPGFAPVNMARDVLQASINNLAARGFIDTAQMLRRWPRAFRRVWIDNWINLEPSETATPGGNRRLTGSYARFVNAGGDMVGWRGNDLEVKHADFADLARRVERRDPADRTLARTLLGWYGGFFAAAETASRLAQFEQRLESGDTEADAALAARDITVDFRKGGLAKPVLNTWYMFLNAGLQGTVNTLRALGQATTLAPSLMILGYLSAHFARLNGGDDERTGQPHWDNVPEYEKTSNLFLFKPDGSGDHIKIPTPYGYNVFTSLGVRIEDAIHGRSSGADVISGAVVDALNAFNPIGGSGITGGTANVLNSLLPTMIRPLGELTANRDFAGRPITPTQFGQFPGPDAYSYFDGTPQGYVRAAQFMGSATGGDEFESGAIDVSPDTLEYLVGYYMSGTGRTLNRLYRATMSDEPTTVADIPVMRSFLGSAGEDSRTISMRYNEIKEALAPQERRLKVLEDPSRTVEDRIAAGARVTRTDQALIDAVKATDKALAENRRALRGSNPETRRLLLEERRRLQRGMIKLRNELTAPAPELQ